uniref:Uncharacterized protein n=1 Tax=Fagus sylvatica TaxID=28930 RepID=A0A2N9GEP9_FAGSY
MPIQKRTVDIRSVLGTRAPELPRVPNAPLASGFSEGESVIKKRKKGEEEAEVAKKQQVAINTEPSAAKSSSKKGRSKDSRTLQKAVGHVSHKRKHQKELPAPWQCEFYVNGRPVNEDDSVWKSKDVRGGQIADALGSALLLPKDMKNWKGNNSTQMIENLKRDSVVAVQGVFEAGYRLIEAERLLNESLAENDRLREVEKVASARIREVESQHKTAEEGLQKAECQLVEMSAKLERECERSSGFQAEIDKLKAELAEARQVSSNAENEAQATYDRGFADAAGSLRLQLRRECNIQFPEREPLRILKKRMLRFWEIVKPLTVLRPWRTPKFLITKERAQTEEVQDMEKGVSDKEDNQIAPNRHIIPFIWGSRSSNRKNVLEISIKVSMYTNDRTFGEFVATEGK